MVAENLSKEDILKELVLDEKDTLQRLKELVDKSKEMLRIEGRTGKTIILSSNLGSREKIITLAIGKYFSQELGLSNSSSLTLDEIKRQTGAGSQALSRPLGMLLKENILEKDNEGYHIKYYQIDRCIDDILQAKTVVPVQPRKRQKKSSTSQTTEQKQTMKQLVPNSLALLAEKSGMSEDEIKHIFEFEDTDVRLIMPIEGRSEGEKQLKATLLYLVAYRYCYGLKEISSKDLVRKLQDLGIRSLVNLSTTLKNYRNFIWHKLDKVGSTSGSYRITTPGEIEGIRIIKEMKKSVAGGETETPTAI